MLNAPGAASIQYEGLRELARALKVIQPEILPELRKDLREVGYVVRDDARARFMPYSQKSAMGFRVGVSLLSSSSAYVTISQRNKRVTGKRPDFGALQITKALLPAREAKQDEAAEILENGAVKLLRSHGF